MLKIANYDIMIGEVPDEVSLAINISNCPYKCKGCHSKYLWEDIGEELTSNKLKELIENNKGISCVIFMGGDQDLAGLIDLINLAKSYNLKSCLYTGADSSILNNSNLLQLLSYIKVGPYIETLGGLDNPTTNQKFYYIDHTIEIPSLIDWTYKFNSKA